MRRVLAVLLVAAGLWACGFGLSDDSGTPYPGLDYWGWQCWDGSQATDAGCPPEPDAGEDGGL